MNCLVLCLPWPPTLNHYYTVARNRKILDRAGRDYKEACRMALVGWDAPEEPLDGQLQITMTFRPPAFIKSAVRKQRWGKRKWDLSNRIKPVEDALVENRILRDDCAIHHLYLHKGDPVGEGCVEIRIVSD